MAVDTPPEAPQRPHVHREHGVDRPDPYHWLRDPDDPTVEAHIAAENAHALAHLSRIEPLRKRLLDEILSRMAEVETTDPIPDGPWVYYDRMVPGKPHAVYCRQPRDGGAEQVLVDADILAEGQEFCSLESKVHSPDHRWLAVAIDTVGDEHYEIRIRDLDTDEWLPDRIVGATACLVWAMDGQTLLWCAQDESQRPYRVHRHVLGTSGPDPVVYEEPDANRSVWCGRSESREWITIASSTRESSEIHLLRAGAPAGPLRCVQPRQQGLRYEVAFAGDAIWILTDDAPGPDGAQTDDAMNSWLATADLDATAKGGWREVVALRQDVFLEEILGFARHVVILEREAGQRRLRVRDLGTGAEHHVTLPETACQMQLAEHHEHDTPWLRIHYSSLSTPETIYRYHMDTRVLEQVWRRSVPGHDPSRYRTWRRQATAPDGSTVHVTLIQRADLTPTPRTPLVVFGYGAYGKTVDPTFMPPWVTYLERGGVFAIAHVRGGAFLGRAWHEQGKYENKQNTISDFIAAVRSLHAGGIGCPETTLLHGSSGGGILLGAVLNQAPGLCTAAFALAPFVDVLTAMLDPSLPLTTAEYEEWGDPRDPAIFGPMHAYSPYDNIVPQDYPDLLVATRRHDPRVPYWGPVKWVARLRERATAGEFLLIVRPSGGHHGSSGRYARAESAAQLYAWVLDRLGLAETPPFG